MRSRSSNCDCEEAFFPMSSTFVYLHPQAIAPVLCLTAVLAVSAQAPHGPTSFEEIVDASFSGSSAQRGIRPSQSAEPIRVDPILIEQRKPNFVGDQVPLGRLKHAPPSKAMQRMQRDQEAFAEGDEDEGVKRLQQAIKIHPDFIEAHNNLGVQYSKRGLWQEAVREFEIAVELDPAAALSHLNLAVAPQALGDSDAAVLNAEEAVRLAPQDSGTHFNLGAILAEQGRRLNEAVDHLSRAEVECPKASLIKAEALLQKGEPGEVHSTLRRFLAMQRARAVR